MPVSYDGARAFTAFVSRVTLVPFIVPLLFCFNVARRLVFCTMRRAGLRKAAAYLVRPDGYVGLALRHVDPRDGGGCGLHERMVR